MSISNLPSAAALDLIASASASAVSAVVNPAGDAEITFTGKTGSYSATWTAPGALAGTAALDLDIIVPWTPAELESRGITCCHIAPANVSYTLTIKSIAADAGGSKIEFSLYSTPATSDTPLTIRFSLC